MLERALPRKHHGYLRCGFITGLQYFKVPYGTTGLGNSGYAFAYSHIYPVAEREKAVRYHYRTRQASTRCFCFCLYFRKGSRKSCILQGFFFQLIQRKLVALKRQCIGILGVGFMNGKFHTAHAVLLPSANRNGSPIARKNNGIRGNPGLHSPGKK